MEELISFESQVVVGSPNHSALNKKAFHISAAGAVSSKILCQMVLVIDLHIEMFHFD